MAIPAFSLSFPAFSNYSVSDGISIGVIGTGSRGAMLSGLISQIEGLNVNACCDVIPARLENGLKNANKGAKAYTEYKKMLDDKTLDAIIIATPLSMHTQMALDTLDAGKHVYCEKIMTYSISETEKLVSKVRGSKKIFQVGFQQRTNPLHNKIYEIIKGGFIGDIKHVDAHYDRNGNWRRKVDNPKYEKLINWRMYKEYSGGLMAELSSHQIDTVNWMLDAHPLRVMGMGGIDYWKDGREIFDNTHCIYEYPGGAKATFNSITSNGYMGYSIKFLGSKGTIEIWNENGQKAYVYLEPLPEKITGVDGVTRPTETTWARGEQVPVIVAGQPQTDKETTTIALKDFARCIRENTKPKSNCDNAAESSIAVHMGNVAMEKGTIEAWKPEYSFNSNR